ncbi:MAG: DUF4252 domain-containing protein, partial [Bacteroidales bacterium]|nr:DUF4252 domain-containing protein [Bacteroidales bacterium]
MKKIVCLLFVCCFSALLLSAQNKVFTQFSDNPKVELVSISKTMANLFNVEQLNTLLGASMKIKSFDGVTMLSCSDATTAKALYDAAIASVDANKKQYVEMLRTKSANESKIVYAKQNNNT